MQLEDMEEGLYQRKQKYMKRIEYKSNCCIGCIPYLRLILLLEVTLFFGWGCYMILQNYHLGEIKSETTSISIERHPSMIESESLSEIQKSKYPNTEMPGIFVKPEVIIDKINNLLEDMKFAKDQNLMENKETVTLVTNVPRMMQANMQNSNNMRSNNVGINAIDRLLSTLSSRNLDKKFTKSSVPQILFSVEYTDKNTDDNIDKDEFFHPALFFEKLRNISKIKATNDLEEIERNDFTENVNRLTLGSQGNHALDESNKLDDLELNVVRILNPENFIDHSEDLINILQDSEQKFSDSTKDTAQEDRDENSLFDDTDKQVNARAEELGIVVCPPYESHEFSDMLTKDSSIGSPTSQLLLAQESSEQIENGSSDDIAERIEDKHDIKDNFMSAFTSGSHDRFDLLATTVQDIEDLYSSESLAKMKEGEKYVSTENTENPYKLWLLRPNSEMIESSPANVDKFQWFNGPPSFVDLGLGDIPKSSEIHHRDSSLLWDTNEGIVIYVDDVIIPESQCRIIIKKGILKVNCPPINEERILISPEIPPTNVSKVTNFGDILDAYLRTECNENANEKLEVENIFNENSDREVTASQNGVPKIINAIESQESTSVKIDVLPDDALPNVAYVDSFDGEEINRDYAFYDSSYYDSSADNDKVKQVTTVPTSVPEFDSSTIDSNERPNLFLDISGTQRQEQLVSKERDYSVSDNSETSLKDVKHFYALKQQLTSLLKNEMSNIMTQYSSKSSYKNNYQNNICNTFRYMRSLSQHSWREQYVSLGKLLEYERNSDNPHSMDDSYYRRKRMTDDLTWQQNQISNTLEEDDKNVDSLEKLRKIFQKMEIIAFCIDRLHERYLLTNKLDDDYASSEFPIETEEHRELYASRIV